MERLGLTHSFGGSAEELGDVVLLSAPEGLTASHGSLPLLKGAYEQDKVIGLTNASEGEINALLSSLGVDTVFPPQDNGSPYELFAVRRTGGGNYFFVTLSIGEVTPVTETMTLPIMVIEGSEDNPSSVEVVEETVSTPIPEVDNSVVQGVRADSFAAWVEETREKAQADAEVKADDIAGDSQNLKELAQADHIDVNVSDMGQPFTIRHTIYSVHDFKHDQDYYFIEQSAGLTAGALWQKRADGFIRECEVPCILFPSKMCKKWCIYPPQQFGQMRRYVFKNYWAANPNIAKPLVSSSPDTLSKSQNISSGISTSLSGSLGFNPSGPTGSLTGGVSFSNSRSFSINDVEATNMSGKDGTTYQTAWQYTFADPTNGSYKIWWSELNDAPELARNYFQPVNQWIWLVPRAFSEKNQSFKSEFTWVTGNSWGEIHKLWIPWWDATHNDWCKRAIPFNVAITPPPLLVLSEGRLNFTQKGESKAVTLVAGRDWTASSDSDWLRVLETSGGATNNEEGTSLHITVNPNDSGSERKGYITVHYKYGDKSQTQKIEVFQSQY